MEQTTETPMDDPPVPPSTARRLMRRSDDRMVAGVAGGIADYFDVDPWLVRAAFIAFTFAGGAGFLIYILGIITLPREDDALGDSHYERIMADPRHHRWLPWIALGVIALIATNGFDGRPHFVWSLVLIGVGVYLLREHHERQPAVPTTPATPGETTPTVPAGITTSAYGRPRRHGNRRRPHSRREPSPLKLLTVGVAMVALAVTVALTHNDEITRKAQQVLAVPMIVLGLGLLVDAWTGRSRGLIIPAILLLPFVIAAGIADVPFSGHMGVQDYHPTSASELRNTYSLGAGRLIVDLSSVHLAEGSRAIDIRQGAGDLVVVVPVDGNTVIDASAGAGKLNVLDHQSDGTSPDIHTQTDGPGGQLQLKIRNGLGHVFVTTDPNAQEAQR